MQNCKLILMLVEFKLKIGKETSDQMIQILYKKFVSGLLCLVIAPILLNNIIKYILNQFYSSSITIYWKCAKQYLKSNINI